MSNPFDTIDQRLLNIENLLLELKNKPIKEQPKPENYNVKETAKLLKVSEQTIHNYIKKGFIPAQTIGRLLLIKRADLENALVDVKSLRYKRS